MDHTLAETRASALIQQELAKYSPHLKISGNNAVILCPFHSERTPSCSVSLGGNVPPGVFHCWGCGAKGTWSVLARQLGLSGIGVPTNDDVHSINVHAIQSRLDGLLDEGNGNDYMEQDWSWDELMPVLKDQPLHTPVLNWRNNDGKHSIKMQFLVKFGCKRFLDPRSGEAFLVIPGNINGMTQFLVLARLNRRQNAKGWKRAKYLSSKKGIGLIGLDEAIKLKRFKKDRILFLVEGPRDALSLLQTGIPACATVGTNTWDKRRQDAIASVDPERICLLFDNDDAGRDASQKIMTDSRYQLPLHNICLPSKETLGFKMDPADLDKKAHRYLYRLAKHAKKGE